MPSSPCVPISTWFTGKSKDQQMFEQRGLRPGRESARLALDRFKSQTPRTNFSSTWMVAFASDRPLPRLRSVWRPCLLVPAILGAFGPPGWGCEISWGSLSGGPSQRGSELSLSSLAPMSDQKCSACTMWHTVSETWLLSFGSFQKPKGLPR